MERWGQSGQRVAGVTVLAHFGALRTVPTGRAWISGIGTKAIWMLACGCMAGLVLGVETPAALSTSASPVESFVGDKAGAERTVQGVAFCWCPPGTFRMGSPYLSR